VRYYFLKLKNIMGRKKVWCSFDVGVREKATQKYCNCKLTPIYLPICFNDCPCNFLTTITNVNCTWNWRRLN
jgi:hypothetical protein